MKIVFCWDDGAKEDLKLFDLHNKYGIPGMFFVPTENREGRQVLSAEEIKKASESPLIDFGCHTAHHTYLTTMKLSEIEKEVSDNKEFLEGILKREVNYFCCPGGKTNNKINKILFKYFKVIRNADTGNFKEAKKSRIIKPSIHFYNRGTKSLFLNCVKHSSFREARFVFKHRREDYFELIKKIIDFDSKTNKVIIIWGHSWEIEKDNLWQKLESLFQVIANNYLNSTMKYDSLIQQAIK